MEARGDLPDLDAAVDVGGDRPDRRPRVEHERAARDVLDRERVRALLPRVERAL